MSRNTGELLPVELLECDGQPFGTPVVEACRQERTVGAETILAAHGLRQAVHDLAGSRDSSYVAARQAIDKTFVNYDAHMTHQLALAEPIGNSIVGWLDRADTADFVSFCRWNVRRTEQLRQRLRGDQPYIAQDIMQRTVALTGADIFPSKAPQRLRQAMRDGGRLEAIDTFERAAVPCDGICEKGRIALAPFYHLPDHTLPNPELYRVAFHEWLHGVGLDYRYGFFHGISTKTGRRYQRWIEEAFVTEAASVAMRVPGLPWRRPTTPDPYPAERQIVQTLFAAAGRKPDLDLLAHAYFEPRDGKMPARRSVEQSLRHGLEKLFLGSPDDGLFLFGGAYEAEPDRRRRTILAEAFSRELQQRLTGQAIATL